MIREGDAPIWQPLGDIAWRFLDAHIAYRTRRVTRAKSGIEDLNGKRLRLNELRQLGNDRLQLEVVDRRAEARRPAGGIFLHATSREIIRTFRRPAARQPPAVPPPAIPSAPCPGCGTACRKSARGKGRFCGMLGIGLLCGHGNASVRVHSANTRCTESAPSSPVPTNLAVSHGVRLGGRRPAVTGLRPLRVLASSITHR